MSCASLAGGLMTRDEFVTKAIGLPWIRHRSDWAAVDCHGLVALYFREVLGIALAAEPETEIQDHLRRQGWSEQPTAESAACFVAWRDGEAAHCGIVLPGAMALHAEGSADRPGSVRVTRLAALMRLYPDIRLYSHPPREVPL